MSDQQTDPKAVFVVHGRNLQARDAVFTFLRALGLKPLEWGHLLRRSGSGAPYIGQVLDTAFSEATAVLVLLTPDEITYLRREYSEGDDDPEITPAGQARPNVLFEAGMALGRKPERTILVEFGRVRSFSDVAGRLAIRLDNSPVKRNELAARLVTAGCDVDTSGVDWLTSGDLTPPGPPGGGLPLGRRTPSRSNNSVRLDARYSSAGRRQRLTITNDSEIDIFDVDIDIPEEAGPSFSIVREGLPIQRLPAGKSASFIASKTMGAGSSRFEIRVTGRTADGSPVDENLFIDLLGG